MHSDPYAAMQVNPDAERLLEDHLGVPRPEWFPECYTLGP